MALAVEVHSVTKTFGAVRALVGVSARFEGGRLSVIEGPNGAGKSTLLSIVGTLARPSSGRVDHGELGRSAHEVRASLGWLGHDALSYLDLSGRENIELAARLHRRDPREAMDVARARFELDSFCERPMRTYSRGQRQRIALARALVHRPRLILLDEPTAGLDAKSTRRLVEIVKEEARAGAIVVVVTHDPAVAAAAEDRVALSRGRRGEISSRAEKGQ